MSSQEMQRGIFLNFASYDTALVKNTFALYRKLPIWQHGAAQLNAAVRVFLVCMEKRVL